MCLSTANCMTSKLTILSLAASPGSPLTFARESSAKLLTAQNAWTLAYAEGYIEGQSYSRDGAMISKSVLVGIDEYCLGFRAGYFEKDRKSSPVRKAASE